jgi:hypothetical protein
LQLLWIVLGFFFGNLAGSFLQALRAYFSSDLLLIFFMVLFFEFISSQIYAPLSTHDLSFADSDQIKCDTQSKTQSDTQSDMLCAVGSDNGYHLWWIRCLRSVNLVKIGCLLGLFVDAYKVGS